VERGRVRVEASEGVVVLEAGQHGEYALSAPSVPASTSASNVKPVAPPSGEWRGLAKSGRYREAYEVMHDLRPKQVAGAEALLAAPAVAGLAGHPAEAIPFLERVLAEFRADSRAPLAAFSLGRILLPARPAEAAARFALARSLSPGGALAEDALAREVEAWSK